MTSPPDTPAAEPNIRAVDLVLILGVSLATLIAVDVAIGGRVRSLETILGLLLLQNGVLLGATYLVAVRLHGIPWRGLGFRPAGRRWYATAALIGLLAFALVGVINWLLQVLTGETFHNPQLRVVAPAGFSWGAFAGMALMVGVVAPLAEELVFRGLLYGWLRRRTGVRVALPLSALIFALIHGIPTLIPAIFVLGILLAFVYERSGSLWPAVVLHGTHNVVNVILLYASLALDIPLQ